MSAPILDLAKAAAAAGPYPLRLNKRERKIAEAAKAYIDALVESKPAAVIVSAGNFSTLSGSATQTIAISGALSTDLAFVVLHVAGATPRTVLTASAASGHVTVVMSGDPSTDHVLSYQLVRLQA